MQINRWNYPNYEAVIPNENPNRLTIDRLSLLSSIKRVSIFANKTTHQVRLKINGSELSVSAEDLDFSNEANERLTCAYEGEDMEIGFNSRFMLEMLNNMGAESVVLELSAPNRAGILVPEQPENDGEDILDAGYACDVESLAFTFFNKKAFLERLFLCLIF